MYVHPLLMACRHLPVHTLTSVGQLEFQVIALPKIGRGGR